MKGPALKKICRGDNLQSQIADTEIAGYLVTPDLTVFKRSSVMVIANGNRETLLKMHEDRKNAEKELERLYPEPPDLTFPIFDGNNNKFGTVKYLVEKDQINIYDGDMCCSLSGDCIASLRDVLNRLAEGDL
jgi:hypothetical protein